MKFHHSAKESHGSASYNLSSQSDETVDPNEICFVGNEMIKLPLICIYNPRNYEIVRDFLFGIGKCDTI